MFRNNFKIALRALLKQKAFSFINIIGLAIGLSASLFILLWVQDELSFDKFNENADRLYVVGLDARLGTQEFKGPESPPPLAFTMVDEFEGVEQATRIRNSPQVIVKYKDRFFSEENLIYVDSTFFEMFSFPFIAGDLATALDRPNTVVISQKMASKYFGNENPIGKTLRIDNKTDLEVTGICEDVPRNSSIQFEFAASFSNIIGELHNDWGSNNITTFLLLEKSVLLSDLDNEFSSMLDKYFGPIIQMVMNITLDEFYDAGNRYYYFLEPILDMHLNTQMSEGYDGGGNMTYVYVLSLIAIFILLIACINFINLSTARSSLRAKEVGVRKILGSGRRQLIFQFLGESLFLSFMGMIIALFLVELLLPAFNNLTEKNLSFSIFQNPILLPSIVGLILFSGLLAGGYAAFVQSSMRILEVLKGKFSTGMKSGKLRNALVVFQFSISIFLIICTITVFSQIQYTRKKDLGFTSEKVLVVNRLRQLEDNQKLMKEMVQNIPGIESVSITRNLPGRGFSGNGILKEGSANTEVHVLARFYADYDILETLEIKMFQGRFFNPDHPTDSLALILNQSAVKSLALEDPLDQRLLEPSDSNFARPIIGVVEDFHFASLHDIIRPMAIELIETKQIGSYLIIRTSVSEITSINQAVKNIWNELAPDEPYEFFFLDEDFHKAYKQERKLGILYSIFSVLAIFIAALGLFGLASFAAEQKTKEIGIRKAVGAQASNIITLLAREFNKWVLLSNILAWPAGYFLMKNWLQNFAFQVEQNIMWFIAAALLTLIIAMLTVLYQSFSAALQNPINSLRHE